MSKVTPSDFVCDPSTSNSRIGVLITMAAKMFGIVSRRFDRRPSIPSSEESVETGRIAAIANVQIPANTYQQSSTRRLAFGTSSFDTEPSKPLNDFYNNSTLTTVSKMFCAVILLTAFVLVMSRSFSHYQSMINNTTMSADEYLF